MNRDEHLNLHVMEECDEVSQRVSKLLRFGATETQPGQTLTNRERIIDEVNDLVAVLDMAGLFELDTFKMAKKRLKVEKYLEYSRTQGTLV